MLSFLSGGGGNSSLVPGILERLVKAPSRKDSLEALNAVGEALSRAVNDREVRARGFAGRTSRLNHLFLLQAHGTLVVDTLVPLLRDHMDDSEYVGVGLDVLQLIATWKPQSSDPQQQVTAEWWLSPPLSRT